MRLMSQNDYPRARVLVVEDQTLLRLLAADMLEEAGFDVRLAENADIAMDVLLSEGADLVFSDINMPGAMDGIGLAIEIERRWPAIGVLLTSGNPPAMTHGGRGVMLPVNAAFLAKPYEWEDVRALLETLAH